MTNQSHKDKSNKPELIIVKGEEQNVARAAIQILKNSDANIFLHINRLERIVRYGNNNTPIFQDVTPIWLMAKLQDLADVKRFDAKKKKFTKTSVPNKVLKMIMKLPELGEWPIRPEE